MGRNFVAEEWRVQLEGGSRLEFLSHSPGSKKPWTWQPTSIDLCERKNVHFGVRSLACIVNPPLMLLRLNWCDPVVWRFASCCLCCWCWNKTKAMLLMQDLSKFGHGFVKVMTGIYQICYMDLFMSYMDLSKTKSWNCQCCYIDLLKFVKVGICISCPLPNKTNLKFAQDF